VRNATPEARALGNSFRESGFDLIRSLQVAQYNQDLAEANRLPDFGRPDALVLVLGNTRKLWNRFIEDLAANPALVDVPDPLDAWVESKVQCVLKPIEVPAVACFAHRTDERIIGMQRLGQLSGLGFVGPCHLSVHRAFGPWVSFRAAVVFDLACDPLPLGAVDTCSGCVSKPCMAQYERVGEMDGELGFDAMRSRWQDWLAIRQACTVGQEYAFTPHQAAYHYTHDRRWLLESLKGSK